MDNVIFDGTWENFKEQVYSVGVEVLGYKGKNHKDWFDDNDAAIKQLLETKHFLHEALLNRHIENRSAVVKYFKDHKAILERELRKMKNGWWKDIFSKVQNASDKRYSRTLYSLLRETFGPQTSPVVPLKSKDGQATIKEFPKNNDILKTQDMS